MDRSTGTGKRRYGNTHAKILGCHLDLTHDSSNCTTSVEIVKIGRRPFTSCKLNIRVILLMKHTWPIFFQFRPSIRFLLRSILPLNHDSPQNVIYLLGAKTKIIEKSVVIEADVKRNEV